MLIEDFPFEVDANEQINIGLSDQLAYLKRCLGGAIELLVPPLEVNKSYSASVHNSLLSLFVRACRRHRQVIAMCELGQADGADIICRSMFESFLPMAFIARQSVRLRFTHGNTPANQFGKPLTQDFRALLFRTHCLLKQEKYLECLAHVPRAKRYAKAKLKQRPAFLDKMLAEVGQDWARELKGKNTCAGLSVEDFAHSMGAHFWYRAIYGDQSPSVHGSDAYRYITIMGEGKPPEISFQSELLEIEKSLWVATGLLGLCINEFSRILDKKHSRYLNAEAFKESFADLKRVFGMEKK